MKMNARVTTSTYVRGAFVYGLVRKTCQVSTAEIEIYDREKNQYKRMPMLLTDKTFTVVHSAVIAPCVLPVYVYQDFNRLEMKMRNVDPKDYGETEKTRVTDYLYC
jgi:hypothetical protein